MMFFNGKKSQYSLGALIKTLNASVECEYLSPCSSGHAALDCCSADYCQSRLHLSTHPEHDTICHSRGTEISACLKPSPGVCCPVEADTRHFVRAIFSLCALYSPHVGFYYLLYFVLSQLLLNGHDNLPQILSSQF